MEEKREFSRLDDEWRLTYQILKSDATLEEPISQFISNISAGGICFMTERLIDPETVLIIELESNQFSSPIRALAQVVRCKRKGWGNEIGVEFSWVKWHDNNAQRTIMDYVISQDPLQVPIGNLSTLFSGCD